MKQIVILICLIGLSVSDTFADCDATTQMLYNSKCTDLTCFDTYIPRFGKSNNVDGAGIGSMKINFGGFMQFVPGTGNVQISIEFDEENPDLKTMKRNNDKSCIESTLYNYKSGSYTGGSVYATDITSTYSSQKEKTTWTFTVPGANLKTVFVEDKSATAADSKYLTFDGFFGYDFTVQGIVQARFNFSVKLKIKSDYSGEVSTQFQGITQNSEGTCKTSTTGEKQCVTEAQGVVGFCENDACSNTVAKVDLHLNENVLLKHSITTTGFETFYFKPIKVVYSSGPEGSYSLYREILEFKSVQQHEGYTIVSVPVSFVYTSVQLTLHSELRTSSGRRMLMGSRILQNTSSTTGALATTSTATQDCIKESASSGCPTCETMCKYGAVDPSYNCVCSQSILMACFALILMAFI